GIAIATAAIYLAVDIAQEYASYRIEGLPSPKLAARARLDGLDLFTWALIAPLAFYIGPRVHVSRSSCGKRAIAWVAPVLSLSGLQTGAEVMAARTMGLTPPATALGTMLAARFVERIAPNLIVLGVMILLYYLLEHYHTLRAREQREAVLQTQLAQAQLE